MDKTVDDEVKEVDLRLELTGDSDGENGGTVENSPKNLSKDSGVNLTPMKDQSYLNISEKVTINEFVVDGVNNYEGESIIINDDESEHDVNDISVDNSEKYIDVDVIGQVDAMDDAFMADRDLSKDLNSDLAVADYEDAYGFSDEEIELSSDEEGPEPIDVSLVCLKRPIPTETTIECLEILDSDEEYPVCLVESEKNEHVNIEEKKGYIKEYIETEGSGIIFSHTFGLVLFHLCNVWVEGRQYSPSRTREQLKIGTMLTFYDQSFSGEEFGAVSRDGVLHQAVVAWTGERPKHLIKKIDTMGEEIMVSLENSRKTFMLYLRGEVFLRCALVRVKGTVVGYITDQIGVVECIDKNRDKVNVFFHTDDVKIYKKPISMYEQTYNTLATKLLPVGLNVSVDARSVHIPGVRNLSYQAVCVLAGSWPNTPHPTLLPGGDGSYCSAYDLSPDEKGTFYYLELALEAKLGRKVDMLKEVLSYTRGNLVFNWKNVYEVKSFEDTQNWREQFINTNRPRREPNTHKRTVKHAFRAPPARRIKTKDELDDSSSVASAGGSYAGSVSGVSSKWSRPHSRVSHTSYMSGGLSMKEARRTWYSQENWGHGGLRIKTEVKSEPGQDREPSSNKKIKTER